MAADNFKPTLGGSASSELPFRIDCGCISNKTGRDQRAESHF